jgi:hypothetical protein
MSGVLLNKIKFFFARLFNFMGYFCIIIEVIPDQLTVLQDLASHYIYLTHHSN